MLEAPEVRNIKHEDGRSGVVESGTLPVEYVFYAAEPPDKTLMGNTFENRRTENNF